MSIRGYSFVFALMKCSYAAFGEQNKRIIISITSVNIYLVSKIRGECVKMLTHPLVFTPSSQVKLRQIPKYVLFSIAIWSKITKHSE